ncbi:MAG: hypothetical protein MK212_17130 [Saprospiraceae bacterium]|nr:hypothetical protein [Saprospiraceae bacterium]
MNNTSITSTKTKKILIEKVHIYTVLIEKFAEKNNQKNKEFYASDASIIYKLHSLKFIENKNADCLNILQKKCEEALSERLLWAVRFDDSYQYLG